MFVTPYCLQDVDVHKVHQELTWFYEKFNKKQVSDYLCGVGWKWVRVPGTGLAFVLYLFVSE